MIKDFFNPPSLVLKARAPIMPKAVLAGPSNDAAFATMLQLFVFFTVYFILIFQLLQPFDTTLYVDVTAIHSSCVID